MKTVVGFLAAGAALVLTGCSTAVQPGLMTTGGGGPAVQGQRMALASFTAKHRAQTTPRTCCLTSACTPCGAAEEQETIEEETLTAGQVSELSAATFVHTLNQACLQQAENTLAPSSFFTFVPSAQLASPYIAGDDEAVSLSRFAVENAVSFVLNVKMDYVVAVGARKRVGLITRWQIHDASGARKGTAWTSVASDEALEVFPQTKDPRYSAIFVDLMRRSAEDFMLMMQGQAPVHSLPFQSRP